MSKLGIEETPLISVIIPVYQMEDYLEDCVESVLAQTYRNIQVLLVDDGSYDRSGSICDAYAAKDERVQVIHQPNGGLSAARNTGLLHASGEYIAHIDADDTMEAACLETLLSLCQRYQVRLAACNHMIVRENGVSSPRFEQAEQERLISRRDACHGVLYHGVPDVSAWGKLYHRSLVETVRYPVGRLYEDTATIADVLLQTEALVYSPVPLYRYRIRQDSISRAVFDETKLDFLWAVDRMTEKVVQAYPEMAKGALRRKVHALLSVRRYFVDCPKELRKKRGELEARVRQDGKAVLRDRVAPVRDKVAIMALYAGSSCYDLLWKALQRRENKRPR